MIRKQKKIQDLSFVIWWRLSIHRSRALFNYILVNVIVATSKILVVFKEFAITPTRKKGRILKATAFNYDYCWSTFDGACQLGSNLCGQI